MRTGLDGEPAADVLGVPDDFYTALGLAQAVSPLRLRGMAAMLARIKNQVRAGRSGLRPVPPQPQVLVKNVVPVMPAPQDCACQHTTGAQGGVRW